MVESTKQSMKIQTGTELLLARFIFYQDKIRALIMIYAEVVGHAVLAVWVRFEARFVTEGLIRALTKKFFVFSGHRLCIN